VVDVSVVGTVVDVSAVDTVSVVVVMVEVVAVVSVTVSCLEQANATTETRISSIFFTE